MFALSRKIKKDIEKANAEARAKYDAARARSRSKLH
jgi:hypothetical protein